MWIAENGRGRFYDVRSPNDLPQIFIKETAVILKSAIYEEPFKPQLRAPSEVTRGIAPGDFPNLLGYVGSTPKARAETPLWTDKGDPLPAHWQYGLGRSVAFTGIAAAFVAVVFGTLPAIYATRTRTTDALLWRDSGPGIASSRRWRSNSHAN